MSSAKICIQHTDVKDSIWQNGELTFTIYHSFGKFSRLQTDPMFFGFFIIIIIIIIIIIQENRIWNFMQIVRRIHVIKYFKMSPAESITQHAKR